MIITRKKLFKISVVAVSILSLAFVAYKKGLFLGGRVVTDEEILELQGYFPDIGKFDAITYLKKINDPSQNFRGCDGEADKNKCILSLAVMNEDNNYCHLYHDNDLGFSEHGHDEELEALEKNCYELVLRVTAEKKINNCTKLSGDKLYNCLSALFADLSTMDDCSVAGGSNESAVCEDVFVFQKALAEYERKFCDKIRVVGLRDHCLSLIIEEDRDTDGDGIPDLKEINEYSTNIKNKDTDNDGRDDKYEIENETNPLVNEDIKK